MRRRSVPWVRPIGRRLLARQTSTFHGVDASLHILRRGLESGHCIDTKSVMTIQRVFGIGLHSRDGKILAPTINEDEADALFEWFLAPPTAESAPIQLLCVQIDPSSSLVNRLDGLKVPLPEEVIDHAIWKHDIYLNLTRNPAGGAVGLIDEPVRFILQTPIDGDSFCSLAMSRHGTVVKGIYIFSDGAFSPETLKGGESSRSAWRSSGLQIITLPEMFLQTHSVIISQHLANLVARVAGIERSLAAPASASVDFDELNRMLHNCHADLMGLERRSRFEETVLSAIESIVGASTHSKLPWPSLNPLKTAIVSRKFDFESLPRRIENFRATMNALMQRRNEQLGLQLAQESHRIAEAALQDSKSMKTIAILTMVLLPGTAVASLFSMDMFDWRAEDGNRIASRWLWVYFVVSVPLTGLILIAWWIWTRRRSSNTRSLGDDLEIRSESMIPDERRSAKDVSRSEVKGTGSKIEATYLEIDR